jgi:multisubunit Na+/H+ antiporter MnhC subunit
MDSVVSAVDRGIISLYTSKIISNAGFMNSWLFCTAGYLVVKSVPIIPAKLQDMTENIMQAVILQDIIQMSDAPFVMHMFNLLCIFLILEPLKISFVTGSAKFILADNMAARLINLGLTGLGFGFLALLVSVYNKKSIPRLAEVAQLICMQIVSNLIQALSPPGMHLVTALLLLQAMSPFQSSHFWWCLA